MHDRIHNLIRNKWIMGGIAVIIIAEVIFLINASRQKPQEQALTPSQQVPANTTDQTDQSIQSVELQKAIAEQMQVDKEYSNWRDENQTQYPWINKMPLATDRYYVYFDLNKKTFIGKVYPKAGENPELMKTEALKELKENKGVPVESFQFEWTVSPKN